MILESRHCWSCNTRRHHAQECKRGEVLAMLLTGFQCTPACCICPRPFRCTSAGEHADFFCFLGFFFSGLRRSPLARAPPFFYCTRRPIWPPPIGQSSPIPIKETQHFRTPAIPLTVPRPTTVPTTEPHWAVAAGARSKPHVPAAPAARENGSGRPHMTELAASQKKGGCPDVAKDSNVKGT